MFLSSSCLLCGLCCLRLTNWFSLSFCDAFLCVGDSNDNNGHQYVEELESYVF